MSFAHFFTQMNNYHPELGWLRSEVFSLTHFSVLAGVMVACCGGNYLPLVACYMAGALFALAWVAWTLWCRYLTVCDRLKVLQRDNLEIAKLRSQLHATKYRLCVATQALESIKQELICPIKQDLPLDPIITSSGYVCSDYALDRYARVSGYYKCPINRARLDACEIVHSRQVSNICDEIRMWESAAR